MSTFTFIVCVVLQVKEEDEDTAEDNATVLHLFSDDILKSHSSLLTLYPNSLHHNVTTE